MARGDLVKPRWTQADAGQVQAMAAMAAMAANWDLGFLCRMIPTKGSGS